MKHQHQRRDAQLRRSYVLEVNADSRQARDHVSVQQFHAPPPAACITVASTAVLRRCSWLEARHLRARRTHCAQNTQVPCGARVKSGWGKCSSGRRGAEAGARVCAHRIETCPVRGCATRASGRQP